VTANIAPCTVNKILRLGSRAASTPSHSPKSAMGSMRSIIRLATQRADWVFS
jgi:hypothetical protein